MRKLLIDALAKTFDIRRMYQELATIFAEQVKRFCSRFQLVMRRIDRTTHLG